MSTGDRSFNHFTHRRRYVITISILVYHCTIKIIKVPRVYYEINSMRWNTSACNWHTNWKINTEIPLHGIPTRPRVDEVSRWQILMIIYSLQWRHNERDGVSNHRCLDGLLNRLFRRRSKKTSKLRVTGLCERNSPVTGEFPSQRVSSTENVSIWWRHHV